MDKENGFCFGEIENLESKALALVEDGRSGGI
jgi:hypothetical protein